MSDKAVFCFIDDAEFELANFRQNAASFFSRVEFVYAKTFTQAAEFLKGRRPVCFLLDLYGSSPEADTSEKSQIPDSAWLDERLGTRAEIGDLFQGLDQAGDEGVNLFLRRLYAQVEKWQSAFQDAADKVGQSRAYGLANLADVRRKYPWAAAVGYSRKALYADAVAASVLGIDGVLQKPQGDGDQAIAQATRRAAPDLARAAYGAVDRRLSLVTAPLGLKFCQQGGSSGLTSTICQALELLGDPDKGSESLDRQKILSTLSPGAMSGIRLEKNDRETLLALGSWLGACE